MPLCLTITSYHKLTPGQCAEKRLERGELTIGRGPDNDWVLPDPERLVSTRHCVIQSRDGCYYLTDTSTNGVVLGLSGMRLRRGNSELLQDGELIKLGNYDIQVRIEAGFGLGEGAAALPVDFDALLGAGGGAAQPFNGEPPGMARVGGGSALDTHPDIFDFLNSAPAPSPAPVIADHLGVDRHAFTPPPAQPAAPPPPAAVGMPASAPGAAIPADWDPFAELMPTAPPAASPALPPVVLEAAPEASMPAPQPEPPAAPVQTTAAVQSASPAPLPPAGPLTQDLLQAFLRGAGVPQLALDAAQAQQQMEAIGRSYRQMVEGLIDVLRARSSLKGEFRMAQTMIRPVENNPLKFAPNVEEALLLLLRPGSQAFMPPDQAVAEGFEDLKAHQIAVMAGVQAAIKHLLKRFQPAVLEERMEKPSGFAALLPGARQAQYWALFTELYAAISREAEDDFQELFGREFTRAYEEQTARMRTP